jgi:hypothetical protein
VALTAHWSDVPKKVREGQPAPALSCRGIWVGKLIEGARTALSFLIELNYFRLLRSFIHSYLSVHYRKQQKTSVSLRDVG